jgi:anthranilate phosphoribosyltransferase
MKEILQYLFKGNKLTQEQAKSVIIGVGKGMYSEAEFASFLTVFNMRPIEPQELIGFREAMIELSAQVDLSDYNGIDIVGTGGDGKNTFNISTLACLIVAGAGINVTKQGNYASSSTSGSSNVLEYFGYKFSNDESKLKNDLEKGHFCFMHAQLFHPAMKHIAPVRKAMKVPTFFNLLGPMINPSQPKYQVLGVNNNENFDHYKNVYKSLDVNYAIIHGTDGYDEISLTTDTRYATKEKDIILSPADFGMEATNSEEIFGGATIEEAAKLFMCILEGNGSIAQNNVVTANAGVAINLVHPEKTLKDCIEIAKDSLLNGKALKTLKAITC